MRHIEKITGICMLLFAIGFNLWLYRLEPTATVDPNDNSFQFALVDRTNQVWDFANKNCSKNLAFSICHLAFLIDHWVPNWAQGYNLPFYYSHVPQIVIVASWRLILGLMGFMGQMSQMSLFQYYHWIIYLLLSVFPLSVFLALRVVRLSWLVSGLGAILASHISTDGLYGLDPPSFLWRGYGLSSQLFAMIWLPLAIAFSYRFFSNQESGIRNQGKAYTKRFLLPMIHDSSFLIPAVFLTFTAMGHLGLGMIAMLSLIPLAAAKPTKSQLVKLAVLAGTVVFFLSYWVVPIFLADNYHNISFWDPPWKFASYGAKETMIRLLNGDLFDWGRGPWMTVLVIVGLLAAAWPKKTESGIINYESRGHNTSTQKSSDSYFILHNSYFSFSLLFLFWLLMYFGRTTWGGLIDLIPAMKEFHLSRFIVGVHAAGLFLVPIGFQTLVDLLIHGFKSLESRIMNYELRNIRFFPILHTSYFILLLTGATGLIIIPPVYKQTIGYAQHNDRLIKQANENHAKVKADEEALFAALGGLPRGRVFAGRGGWWGKDFKVAETPYYMNLSTYGIPTVLWLPETWSPNSDVEQYFSEDQAKDYDLFGIRYVTAPPTQKPQSFWKLIKEAPTWKLYEVTRSVIPSDRRESRDLSVGYFTTGVRPAVVATDKRSYGNVVRLWIQSDAHTKGLYPELTFAKNYPRSTGLPNFKMLDEVTYRVPDGTTHNLFKEPPWYQNTTNTTNTTNNPILQMEENDHDMIFKAKVHVPENCSECIVILKQSYHPNWKATIDGKPAATFTVFPFFLATLVPAGTHDIVFSYEPSGLKITLMVTEFIFLFYLLVKIVTRRSSNRF